MPKIDSAQEYFAFVGLKLVSSDKVESVERIYGLKEMKYDILDEIKENIKKIVDITAKLIEPKIVIAACFLVYHILNSLPLQFGQLKSSYTTQKDKWDISEVIAIRTQKERIILRKIGQSVRHNLRSP